MQVIETTDRPAEVNHESMIHIEINRQTDPDLLARLEVDLNDVLDNVSAAVTEVRRVFDLPAHWGCISEFWTIGFRGISNLSC